MIYILLALFSTTTFQSCKKVPNNLSLGLHSRTELIASTWKVEKYIIDGEDYTSSIAGYTETYSKMGNYVYSQGGLDEINNWSFKNHDSEINVTGISNSSSEILYVLKLNEKEFWYYYMDGKDRKELHLVPQKLSAAYIE